ncbi:hypothetical protein [Lacticaseibacillus pantheris]|uniref:hypothetical protein n=1 Tax=Lacticaseibacillus pantheris TaxID=171523 RepID=UPI00265B1007|nr:hypothetical protein [Lacticaseibacillus pantheris]WKF84459.1 hypothetical protein QY874_09220 [Lacticaseibacillus pantheris]
MKIWYAHAQGIYDDVRERRMNAARGMAKSLTGDDVNGLGKAKELATIFKTLDDVAKHIEHLETVARPQEKTDTAAPVSAE